MSHDASATPPHTGSRISYAATDGLSYDPNEPKYWDKQALDKEIERVFEVCHGCRMCFKYCDSFPNLFRFIDDKYDGDLKKLTAQDTQEVMDACFQCKLCEVQCPYTPREGHEFQLDFPKLVHRYNAIKAKERDVAPPLRDKILADPDLSGKAARASFGMANKLSRVKLHRIFMEKTLGIHRDKLLPDFSNQTFEKMAEEKGKLTQQTNSEAVLFQTCYVQNNEPDIGFDTLEVLEHNGVQCGCVKGLGCCGMPAWERGDLPRVQQLAKHNLDRLMPYVEAGAKVLAINPTCSMMMKQEYAELVGPEDQERAKKLAEAVQNPTDFLWNIRKEERFQRDFQSTPGEKVAYHAPCHLRAQAVGFKGRDLIRMIPGVTPSMTLECCGHDGTYAMKVEGFEPSARIGKKSFDEMQSAKAEIWATDCPLAAIQFEQHAGVKPMHPMSILARAYRKDGFPQSLETPEKETDS
jgi:Fe-S oxidoreductase